MEEGVVRAIKVELEDNFTSTTYPFSIYLGIEDNKVYFEDYHDMGVIGTELELEDIDLLTIKDITSKDGTVDIGFTIAERDKEDNLPGKDKEDNYYTTLLRYHPKKGKIKTEDGIVSLSLLFGIFSDKEGNLYMEKGETEENYKLLEGERRLTREDLNSDKGITFDYGHLLGTWNLLLIKKD